MNVSGKTIMFRKLKCYLLGHSWKQVGYNKIVHQDVEEGQIVMECRKDHFLFICTRCTCLREEICEHGYYEVERSTLSLTNTKIDEV